MARDFKGLRESVVKTADKKPEKFTKPDGKVGIRMVPVDKEIVKNEDASKEAQYHAQGIKDARADMKAAKSNDAMTKAMNKLQHHTKAHKKAKAAMSEAKVDEISMTAIKKGVTGSGMKNVAKAMGKDKLKKDLESMKARMATEAYDEPQGQAKRMMSPLQKARMDKEKADRDSEGKLKRGRSTLSRLRDIQNKSNAMAAKPRKEEVEQVDEVLDRPGALDSYRKKADASGNRARNSATRKILTAPKDGKRPDHSDELKTMRKRNKGQDMADRVAARQFRKSIGQPYIKKEATDSEIANAGRALPAPAGNKKAHMLAKASDNAQSKKNVTLKKAPWDGDKK